MTIGVGAIDHGGVWLASDSMGSAGPMRYNEVRKIFYFRHLAYVISGTYAGAHFIYKALTATYEQRPCKESSVISVTEMSFELKKILAEAYWPPHQEDGRPPFWDLSFLLTDGQSLYEFQTNLHPERVKVFEAIGSGLEMAYGAFYACYENDASTEMSVRAAAETCSKYHLSCGGKVRLDIITSPQGDEERLCP